MDKLKLIWLGCSSLLATFLIRNIFKRFVRNDKESVVKEPVYKCLFFTEKGLRGSENNLITCKNALSDVVEFINESKLTLDICFFLITDFSVVDAIIKTKQRNVDVRIITDYFSGIVYNKYAKQFYKEGVQIFYNNVPQNQTIMHNKFCIRDNNMVLQTSMNLTRNTSKGSFDNILISNEPELVAQFRDHFQMLVEDFQNK